jgi:hypothetical protein
MTMPSKLSLDDAREALKGHPVLEKFEPDWGYASSISSQGVGLVEYGEPSFEEFYNEIVPERQRRKKQAVLLVQEYLVSHPEDQHHDALQQLFIDANQEFRSIYGEYACIIN